ncbi:MAG TPA: DUF4091 domain-containing protein [Verrucomicrobiota bacterium]|nr:DUF4091 domain-containing protein [Verrucomicrobiota bacterium]HNU52736.1 DUF4091 domain-containing protein [Verrucomicrobiota bacterium]
MPSRTWYSLRRHLASALLLLSIGTLQGQPLLPNGSLAEGVQQPAGWQLTDGKGEWTASAAADTRLVSVQGTGEDQSCWRAQPLANPAGEVLAFRFRGRRAPDAAGGTAIAGLSRVNRDFPLTPQWQNHRFVFNAPEDGGGDFARVGQWHVKGRLEFDDVELVPVRVSHRSFPGREERTARLIERALYKRYGIPLPATLADSIVQLGEAESLEGNTYRFQPQFGWRGANYHRPLWRNRASFNTDRWVFSKNAEVAYGFDVGGRPQTAATVHAAINYHNGGILRLEASPDGAHWLTVAELGDTRRNATVALPPSLFPTRIVFVRMLAPADGTDLQVNTFAYEATLENALPGSYEGATRFLEVDALAPDANLSLEGFTLDPGPTAGEITATLAVANHSNESRRIGAQLWTSPQPPARNTAAVETQLKPHESQTISLRAQVGSAGDHPVELRITDRRGRSLLEGRSEVRVPWLHDPRIGYAILPGAHDPQVWWCEGGWKVGRHTPPPPPGKTGGYKAVTLSAAQGEYEPVQIVLVPQHEGRLLESHIDPWKGKTRASAPIETRLNEVAYVRVTTPTDGTADRGWYPDPLPPLVLPQPLRPGQNFPLWLTVRVPPGTPPGPYTSTLHLKTDLETLEIPLALRVHNFALSPTSHLRSALGLGADSINRYHRLTDRSQQETVFNRYLENFAEHRISPYSFFDYAPITVSFSGEGAGKTVHVDFTRFDAVATLWLDSGRFNTFQLPVAGMGGGTFHERYLGEFGGFKEGTPEHARLFNDYLRLVEQHLREKGWLDRAFVYWFDEPDPKDYAFVIAGMKRLKEAAPGLKRMLTEQPEPELFGHVDVWCGLTPEWTPERVRARRQAGEEVWWYICTAPKAPYVTEFIDHPGTELRLWPWQSWQYGVTGILVWATLYWTSPVAYPAPALQDPWQDPMSWVSGYGTPVGSRLPWGNGDGRFLYPPQRDPNAPAPPNLDAPVNSIRWENLRDGIEDYEYFWLLDREIEQRAALQGESALTREARSLLTVPAEVSQDLTRFTTDPRPLLDHREKLARMIERLQRTQRKP